MDIGKNFQTPFKAPGDISSLITTFLNISFVVAGVILLFFFIFGGIKLMSSAGNEQDAEVAKKTLTSALIGFIVVFVAYWIVKLIGVITGTTII